MTTPRLALILELLAVCALMGGLARERAAAGIQGDLLALACLLLPFHQARGWAWAGRTDRLLGRWVTPLEWLTLAGSWIYPPPGWAFWTGGGASVLFVARGALGAESEPQARLSSGEDLPGRVALISALAVCVVSAARGEALALLWVVGLVPAVWEALHPRRGRRPVDGIRRLAAGCVLLASCLGRSAGTVLPTALAYTVGTLAMVALFVSTGAATSRRSLLRVTGRVLVPAVILALVFAAAELTLRAFPNSYRDAVVSLDQPFHVPGALYRYEGPPLAPRVPPERVVEFRWNSRGWHDVDHALEKAPGSKRLLVLGDSYVEGIMVPTEQLLARQVERLLAPHCDHQLEVISLGHSSWGQAEELRCLDEEGLAYDPDVVVLEFLPANDLRNNLPALEQAAQEDYWGLTPARRLSVSALRSRVLSLAFACDKLDLALRALRGRVDPIDAGAYQETPAQRPELWAAAWTRTEELLRAFQARLDLHRAQLVVVVFTSPAEIEARVAGTGPVQPGALDVTLPARRITAICQRLGIPCLDLADRFARLPPEERSAIHMLPWDGHWGPEGHAAAAREVTRFLLETGIWAKAMARAE